MIRLTNATKIFQRGREAVHALNKVSLEIAAGQMALVRGPSGSGKTTLINLCAGLASPTAGTVHIGRYQVHAMTNAQRAAMRAREVAVVFQLFHLTPYLNAVENILLPALISRTPDALDRAKALMCDLRIEHRAHHLPGEMSAGERQRCALARALLLKPSVILADEPTGNLDEISAALVLQTLASCRCDGAAILLVSHHPVESIRPDIIFTLRDGSLIYP